MIDNKKSQFNWESCLKRFAWVLLFTLTWTILLPGIIAYKGGSLFQAGVRQKLTGDAKRKMDEYDDRRAQLTNQVAIINRQISALIEAPRSDSKQVLDLFEVRKTLETDLATMTPPLVLKSFYLGSAMVFWPMLYFFISVLVFVIPPGRLPLNRGTVMRIVLLSIGILIFYRWPAWLRNHRIFQEGRLLYANESPDINLGAFWMQEFMGIGISILIAVLWMQWFHFESKSKTRASAQGFDYIADAQVSADLISGFIYWQFCSLLLFLAFFGMTKFFWDTIVRDKDQRFIIHAVVVHLLWALTWIIVSFPFLRSYIKWRCARAEALADILHRQTKHEERDLQLKLLAEMMPVGTRDFVLGGFIAALPFFVPIVQALFK